MMLDNFHGDSIDICMYMIDGVHNWYDIISYSGVKYDTMARRYEIFLVGSDLVRRCVARPRDRLHRWNFNNTSTSAQINPFTPAHPPLQSPLSSPS